MAKIKLSLTILGFSIFLVEFSNRCAYEIQRKKTKRQKKKTEKNHRIGK